MRNLTSFLERNSLPVYFFLAYVFAWAFAPLTAISPVYGLAGIIVSGMAGG